MFVILEFVLTEVFALKLSLVGGIRMDIVLEPYKRFRIWETGDKFREIQPGCLLELETQIDKRLVNFQHNFGFGGWRVLTGQWECGVVKWTEYNKVVIGDIDCGV